MRGRVFHSYFPQQALNSVGRHKKILHESSEAQSYQRLWQEAMGFMREQENGTVDLPADSPEKLRIKAITGVIQKYKPDGSGDNEKLRSQLENFGNELEELVDSSTNHISQYVTELVRGVRELFTQIIPQGEVDTLPEDDTETGKEPPSEGEKGGAKQEEPEKPIKDSEELAQALGLHDSVLRMKIMRSNLHEGNNEQLQPGQTVVRVVDGELKKMQVVLDKDGQIALVDPEKLDKVDMAKRQEIAPTPQDDRNPS